MKYSLGVTIFLISFLCGCDLTIAEVLPLDVCKSWLHELAEVPPDGHAVNDHLPRFRKSYGELVNSLGPTEEFLNISQAVEDCIRQYKLSAPNPPGPLISDVIRSTDEIARAINRKIQKERAERDAQAKRNLQLEAERQRQIEEQKTRAEADEENGLIEGHSACVEARTFGSDAEAFLNKIDVQRLTLLEGAGDTESACSIIRDAISLIDKARKQTVICSKQIRDIEDGKYIKYSDKFLLSAASDKAIEESFLAQKNEQKCDRKD